MCAGVLPFRGEAVMVMYDQIQEAPLEFPAEVPASPALKRLLLAMLMKDPAKRPSLAQLLADPWLNPGSGLQARAADVLAQHLHEYAPLMRMRSCGSPGTRLQPASAAEQGHKLSQACTWRALDP
jgi:serine/threonine protein kinase